MVSGIENPDVYNDPATKFELPKAVRMIIRRTHYELGRYGRYFSFPLYEDGKNLPSESFRHQHFPHNYHYLLELSEVTSVTLFTSGVATFPYL